MSTYNLIILQSQLSQFGLNPLEWSLRKVHALRFILENTQDENFKIEAQLTYKNQKLQWQSLEVISL